MALRCERCRTADLTLESFGVYQCPNCGRVDADGHVLDGREDDKTGPQVLDTGRASFVAPPPPGAGVPIAAAPSGGREMPKLFFATLVISGLLNLGSALMTHSVLGFVMSALFYGALFTGKSWARWLSVFGSLASIVLCVLVIAVFRTAPPVVRMLLTVVVLTDGWWLYVLMRPDTAAYFRSA
ncbi:MAG: hypothetical protein U0234_13390 [Sandaracinus sp.]